MSALKIIVSNRKSGRQIGSALSSNSDLDIKDTDELISFANIDITDDESYYIAIKDEMGSVIEYHDINITAKFKIKYNNKTEENFISKCSFGLHNKIENLYNCIAKHKNWAGYDLIGTSSFGDRTTEAKMKNHIKKYKDIDEITYILPDSSPEEITFYP